MQYETLIWLAPTLVGVAVFSAVCAVFWPREREIPPVLVAALRNPSMSDLLRERLGGGKPRIG